MKLRLLIIAFAIIFSSSLFAQMDKINLLSSYSHASWDGGAAEIVTYDPATQRLFVGNGDAKAVDVYDISDPLNISLIATHDITSYGKNLNSVAFKNGILAVAVEADPKQDDGVIVLMDADGNELNVLNAGALPDNVVWTHDGNYVISANEGEPSDDYLNDPEGSVTVVNVSSGAANATATTIDFKSWNDKKASLINKGVRIFGPNATVAQDLEPEYVAVSSDNSIAYISCQENNAMAVVDLTAMEVIDIYSYGYKDHLRGQPILHGADLTQLPNWPTLGTPAYGGDPVNLGGFSGLCFDPASSNENELVFWTIPDRGPNESTVAKAAAGTSQNLRPFKLPDYQARLVKITFDPNNSSFEVSEDDYIFLTRKDGTTPISGRGNIPGFDEVPVTRTDSQVYTNVDYTVEGVDYHALEYDEFGGDFEGVIRDNEGNFWMCDEYRPAIYKFAPNGTLIERFVPEGTSLLGDEEMPAGTYGAETLPAVYSKRRANRGFEAISYDPVNDVVYAFIQSPMYNPSSATRNNSDLIRILGVKASDGTPVEEYVYLLEQNALSGYTNGRVDKIGDAVWAGNGIMYVLERDSGVPGEDESKKYIYRIDINSATNILGTDLSNKMTSEDENDKTLEMMSADDLKAGNIMPVFKIKTLNLPSIGYLPSDKPEGLAYVPNPGNPMDFILVVLNDNDFGLAGAGVSDKSEMGFIELGDRGVENTLNSMDASNKDDAINIASWPTWGMYMPDAIDIAVIDGKDYIVTANEGDAREYIVEEGDEEINAFISETRVKDLTLDPMYFPNASELQQEENLGRIKTSQFTSDNFDNLDNMQSGDIDNDGENEYIFTFGARSFSIFDMFGNLVYDSGNNVELWLSQLEPDNFNSTNDENDSFDNRSDDKGAEPEAVEVAVMDGKTYVLLGLERIGGVMIFDISDLKDVKYVNYFNNRDFSVDFSEDATEEQTRAVGDAGPEGVIYISPEESPIDNALIVTANEITGSVSVHSIGDVEGSIVDQMETNSFLKTVAPSQTSIETYINLQLDETSLLNISVVDINGKEVISSNKRYSAGIHFVRVDASQLSAGAYYVRVVNGDKIEVANFIVK